MTDHPGFSPSVLLRYFVYPALLLALLTLVCARVPASWWPRLARPRAVLWALIVTFWLVYGVMGTLAYLGLRTAIQDLGVYDQRVWILSTTLGLPLPTPGRIIAVLGHFSPVLVVHALLYKIYPTALVLIWTQVLVVGIGAAPVYRLASRHLGAGAALAFAAAYLLYPSVVFSVRFDFHPDHLLIPLMLFAFDLLDRRSEWALAGVSGAMLLIKESLIPSVTAFGAYAVIVRKRYVLGLAVALVGIVALAVLVTGHYADVFMAGTSGGQSYGYLGGDLPTILHRVVFEPWTWLRELVQVPKLKFVFLMLAPLVFLPLVAPMALIAALPALAMSLLSQHPHRYQIWAQYTAPLVPPLVVAGIFGFKRLAGSRVVGRWLPRGRPASILIVWLLGAGLYFDVFFSPSPISTVFWLGRPEQHRWSYEAGAYAVSERDRAIWRAIERYIPTDPRIRVSSQNSLNSSRLAHRLSFVQFPTDGEFVVVDLRRPPYMADVLDPAGFAEAIAELKRQQRLLHESDGFFIFGPRLPAVRPAA